LGNITTFAANARAESTFNMGFVLLGDGCTVTADHLLGVGFRYHDMVGDSEERLLVNGTS
jgi:hypothetical protein